MPSEKSRIGPPSPQILETEIGDEISLYDPATENVVVLNQTASDIWRLSDGDSDVEGIVTLLAAAYGLEANQIRQEVEDTITKFREQGLLQAET
jgi:hypothetical protein